VSYEAPQWKIEIRTGPRPEADWIILTLISGRPAKYVDRGDAEAAMRKLNAVQPHAVLRISPV